MYDENIKDTRGRMGQPHVTILMVSRKKFNWIVRKSKTRKEYKQKKIYRNENIYLKIIKEDAKTTKWTSEKMMETF